MGCVRNGSIEDRLAVSAYLLWGDLTDHYEMRRTRRLLRLKRSCGAMANEWLAIGGDNRARKKYFRRWDREIRR